MRKCSSTVLYAACTFRPYKSTSVLKLFRTFTGRMTRGLSLRMVFSLLFQDTLLCSGLDTTELQVCYVDTQNVLTKVTDLVLLLYGGKRWSRGRADHVQKPVFFYPNMLQDCYIVLQSRAFTVFSGPFPPITVIEASHGFFQLRVPMILVRLNKGSCHQKKRARTITREVKPVWDHLKVERSLQSPRTEATRDRDYRSSNPETDSRSARGNIAVLYIERKRVEGELQLPEPTRDALRGWTQRSLEKGKRVHYTN